LPQSTAEVFFLIAQGFSNLWNLNSFTCNFFTHVNNLVALFYVCLFVVNSAVITYNAALNRPAYLSSLYTREAPVGPFTADRANDGSRHTNYNSGTRCAVTNATANPWWAVDLGQPMTIYRVHLTSSERISTKPNITSLELLDL